MDKLYQCDECKELHTVKEWEENTKQGFNRETRRKYWVNFLASDKIHFTRRTAYKCPSCNTMVGRLNIKLVDIDDTEVIDTSKANEVNETLNT